MVIGNGGVKVLTLTDLYKSMGVGKEDLIIIDEAASSSPSSSSS